MTTATCVLLCRVRVTGTPREPDPHPTLGPLPAIPEDGGVAKDLWQWMAAERLYPALNHGPSAPGVTFDALFTPADARRVMAWLSGRGVHPPVPTRGS